MSTNAEKLEVIIKPKLTIRDICVLMDCGTKTAIMHASEFRAWFEEEYPSSPWVGIPTDLFTALFHINENRIIRNAEIEKMMRNWPAKLLRIKYWRT